MSFSERKRHKVQYPYLTKHVFQERLFFGEQKGVFTRLNSSEKTIRKTGLYKSPTD